MIFQQESHTNKEIATPKKRWNHQPTPTNDRRQDEDGDPLPFQVKRGRLRGDSGRSFNPGRCLGLLKWLNGVHTYRYIYIYIYIYLLKILMLLWLHDYCCYCYSYCHCHCHRHCHCYCSCCWIAVRIVIVLVIVIALVTVFALVTSMIIAPIIVIWLRTSTGPRFFEPSLCIHLGDTQLMSKNANHQEHITCTYIHTHTYIYVYMHRQCNGT